MAGEHSVQNEIRNDLAGECLLFRANVGRGWTGEAHRLPNGDVLIKNPRPFSTGLPEGFSDLFGMVRVEITSDMVGQVIAQFVALEVKAERGKVRDKQASFLNAVKANGGRAGVVRSPADARAIVKGDLINDA